MSEQHIEQKLFTLDTLFEVGRVVTSALTLESVLDNILLTALGRVPTTRGLILLRQDQNRFTIKLARGKGREQLIDQVLTIDDPIESDYLFLSPDDDRPWVQQLRGWGVELVFPIRTRHVNRGMLGMGGKASGERFTEDELIFLHFLANISANSITNGLMYDRLKTTNRHLDLKIHEMQTLFDVTKELTSTLRTDEILNTLILSLMGQLMISRCAIILEDAGKPVIKVYKGFRVTRAVQHVLGAMNFSALVQDFHRAMLRHEISDTTLRDLCSALDLEVLVPMRLKDEVHGIMGLGKKRLNIQFTEHDRDYLSALATQAMIALENARLFEETLEKQRMEEELRVARSIQKRLLPKSAPTLEGFDIFGMNIPSRHVSGDYFDFIPITPQDLGIAIGDVSGKGTPASLLMASLQATLWAQVENRFSISEIMSKVNDAICRTTETGKFITLFYGVLNQTQKTLTYCNAGHSFPIIHHADGEIERLNESGLILGVFPNQSYSQHLYGIQPGDTLVFFTDGVDEAINSHHEEFGEDALIDVIRRFAHLSARELAEKIRSELQYYVGEEPQYDDITLIIIKRL
ncbi:MAG: hypothetical protein D6675_01085 [Gemmatimonadetes bacterium]|nr:MAG: hypothetical protein D6675_01085 [Gemmatimonadota bacterium]